MKELTQVSIEFVRLHGDSNLPAVPWKVLVEWRDWFWPVGWFIYPISRELWIVKKESPLNELAKEKVEVTGVKVNGEMVFAEPEWNNQVLEIWSREEVFALFEAALKEEKYSGVAIKENWTFEERENAEEWHRLMRVIRGLLQDEDVLRYGKATFLRHVERYYSKWLTEFRGFFETLAEVEDRKGVLEAFRGLQQRYGFENGYFMYVYYP
jgi:hypothetical protein